MYVQFNEGNVSDKINVLLANLYHFLSLSLKMYPQTSTKIPKFPLSSDFPEKFGNIIFDHLNFLLKPSDV